MQIFAFNEKVPTLEAGILQNTDVLLVMATIFEQLALDNTNPFFLTLLYIPILPLFGNIPTMDLAICSVGR